MSEHDNGFARAQQMYDQQEPPDYDGPCCPICEGVGQRELGYAKARIEEIKRSIQAQNINRQQHQERITGLEAELAVCRRQMEDRQATIDKLTWELGLLERVIGGE